MLPGKHAHLDRKVDAARAARVDRRQFLIGDAETLQLAAAGDLVGRHHRSRRAHRRVHARVGGEDGCGRLFARRLVGLDRLCHPRRRVSRRHEDMRRTCRRGHGRRRIGRLHHLGNVDRLRRVGRLSLDSARRRVDRSGWHHLDGLAHAGRLIHRRGLAPPRLAAPCRLPANRDRRAPGPACRRRSAPPRSACRRRRRAASRARCWCCRRRPPGLPRQARRAAMALGEKTARTPTAAAARRLGKLGNMDPSRTQNRFKNSGQQ